MSETPSRDFIREIVRADLDPRIKARLKEILLTAADDPAAKDVLKSYEKTSKFDELTPEMHQVMANVQRKVQDVEDPLE